MAPRRQTNRPFRDELPRLLAERGMTARELARRVEIDQGYISLVVSGKRRPSRKLLERSAVNLGLEPSYWREFREDVVVEAIRADEGGALLDRLYRLVIQGRR